MVRELSGWTLVSLLLYTYATALRNSCINRNDGIMMAFASESIQCGTLKMQNVVAVTTEAAQRASAHAATNPAFVTGQPGYVQVMDVQSSYTWRMRASFVTTTQCCTWCQHARCHSPRPEKGNACTLSLQRTRRLLRLHSAYDALADCCVCALPAAHLPAVACHNAAYLLPHVCCKG
jgi:hypothetical protein